MRSRASRTTACRAAPIRWRASSSRRPMSSSASPPRATSPPSSWRPSSSTFDRLDRKAAHRKNLSDYDVLIIASMIEREAQVAKDRRLISAVIYNRLQQHIPLGIDATLRYILDNWSRPLKQSELQKDSAFNTRMRQGLPPTPIGSPGLASIQGGAEPGQGQLPVLRRQALRQRRARLLGDRRPVHQGRPGLQPQARARSAARTRRTARTPMKRLGVLGWPVSHSRSPQMHNAALAQLGLKEWHYQRLPVPPEVFDETVRGLPAAGFVGANVTIPHKEAALALADEATDAARAIGAANTLSFAADGAIAAANTDAPGFLADACRDRPPARPADRARPRRRRLGARRRLRAARGGRGPRRGLEPHRPSAPPRWPPTSALTPLLGRSRPTCWSTARVSGWRTGTSRICRSPPMRWAHMQPWRTWSTGPAAPS